MPDEQLDAINAELRRVVGAAGATATLEEHDDLGLAARVETSQNVCHVAPERLLEILRALPDHAGPLAMREAIELQQD